MLTVVIDDRDRYALHRYRSIATTRYCIHNSGAAIYVNGVVYSSDGDRLRSVPVSGGEGEQVGARRRGDSGTELSPLAGVMVTLPVGWLCSTTVQVQRARRQWLRSGARFA